MVLNKTLLKTGVKMAFGMAVAIAAGSCCTHKYCIGADDMDNIRFDHFSNSDLDTILIQRFNRNSNFANPVEDILVITSNFSVGSNFQRIQLPVKLTIDFDYKVALTSTGEHFTISDFISKEESCNTGFMCNDAYNSLESYSVNGETMSTYQLEISR
jgi:hypothetical protein